VPNEGTTFRSLLRPFRKSPSTPIRQYSTGSMGLLLNLFGDWVAVFGDQRADLVILNGAYRNQSIPPSSPVTVPAQ